jgi:NADPH:quinone reductase-like Zn-dependent oxidoreductase
VVRATAITPEPVVGRVGHGIHRVAEIAAALGARALGVASPGNHDYLQGPGASGVFDYHAADWVQQVQAAGGRDS